MSRICTDHIRKCANSATCGLLEGLLGGYNQLFLSVQNLFKKEPPPAGNTGGPSSAPDLFRATANGDDFIGRYFMVRLPL